MSGKTLGKQCGVKGLNCVKLLGTHFITYVKTQSKMWLLFMSVFDLFPKMWNLSIN